MQTEPFADILDENETLLWTDKPNRRAWMTNGYIFLAIGIAFCIIITIPMLIGFSVGLGSMSTKLGFFTFFAFFYGLPFYLSIVYLYWLHCAEKKTVYAKGIYTSFLTPLAQCPLCLFLTKRSFAPGSPFPSVR